MTKRTRQAHSPGFKAKAAPAALKGDKTPAELAKASMSTRADRGLEGAAGRRRGAWHDNVFVQR